MAVHILLCIERFEGEYKLTSEFLASSINANPVIIRRLLTQLKAAGIIEVKRGSGGAATVKPLNELTLYDLYRAVDCVDGEGLFRFHDNPNPLCPVGRNIHSALDASLTQIQAAMENEMRKISVAQLADKCSSLIESE